MAAWSSMGGSSNKHRFADTEIEITTKTSYQGIVLMGQSWKIHVVATMRPRRLLSSPWRKTATDTADVVLQVDFPEDVGEGGWHTETRKGRDSVSAMYSYEKNPWHPRDREWWQFWRTQQCAIRYGIQVEHLGNSYAFSGDLDVFEPQTQG